MKSFLRFSLLIVLIIVGRLNKDELATTPARPKSHSVALPKPLVAPVVQIISTQLGLTNFQPATYSSNAKAEQADQLN